MPKNPVAVMSIVSTPLAEKIAENYGVELRQDCWIQVDRRPDRTARGSRRSRPLHLRFRRELRLPESSICPRQRRHHRIHADLRDVAYLRHRLQHQTASGRDLSLPQYGRYLQQDRHCGVPRTPFSGMRQDGRHHVRSPREPARESSDGGKVPAVTDYAKPEETGGFPRQTSSPMLPSRDGAKVMIRPSGTEPKIKAYYTTLGKDLAAAEAEERIPFPRRSSPSSPDVIKGTVLSFHCPLS